MDDLKNTVKAKFSTPVEQSSPTAGSMIKLEKKINEIKKETAEARDEQLNYQTQQEPLMTSLINNINSIKDRVELLEGAGSTQKKKVLNNNSELDEYTMADLPNTSDGNVPTQKPAPLDSTQFKRLLHLIEESSQEIEQIKKTQRHVLFKLNSVENRPQPRTAFN